MPITLNCKCKEWQGERQAPSVPQRELVRKSCRFITVYFCVLSLEYLQVLSSST